MKFLNQHASRLAIAAGLMALAAGTAHAEATANGTAAGTPVENTFTLDYEVNSTPQTQITPPTPTTFTVDRIVDLTLAVSPTGTQQVAADEQGVSFVYTITNEGNDIQSYSVNLEDITGDDFEALNPVITYSVIGRGGAVDLDNNGGVTTSCEGATVTGTITSFAALTDDFGALGDADPEDGSADITCPILPDEQIEVTITFDIPDDAVVSVGDVDDFHLIAQTREPAAWLNTGVTGSGVSTPNLGGTMDATPGTNVATTVENVFLDAIDATSDNDEVGDGRQSVTNAFEIVAPFLTATKEAWVLDTDPASAAACAAIPVPATAPTADQFPIPGACVLYVIEVVNDDTDVTRDARAIDISDQLPVEVQYAAHQQINFSTDGTPTLTTCAVTDVAPARCTVAIDDAELDAGETGRLAIHAVVR